MQSVKSVAPVAPYIGGKSKLAKTIISIIDEIPHTTYAEPFVGMGGVFLRRQKIPKSEVINDYSKDVSTFFRVMQRHYSAFIEEMMKHQVTSRSEFERLKNTDPNLLTDLERSARFFYLQRTAFGGKVHGRSFGVSTDRSARFDINQLKSKLDDLHKRLSGTVIECLPYQDFITKYDRSGTLFYLDPPYYGNETDYGKNVFHRSDFEKLADQLSGIKGKFILSINDVPDIREIFSGFEISSVMTTYSVGLKNALPAGELIIQTSK